MPEPGIAAHKPESPAAAALAGSASRQEAMADFLDRCGWPGAVPVRLAGDASFRSYYRLRRGTRRAMLMDAPPPQEAVGPYVAVSAILRRLGLSAPEILAVDRDAGFLLIEDFGDETYSRLLADREDETALYALAIDTLAALQRAVGETGMPDLPAYDPARLLGEAALFCDWYMPETLGSPVPGPLREEYLSLWARILPQATEPWAPTLVLRDFHIDNLMLLRDREGVRRCGLLDFQDAVLGAPSYDLVSLVEDARRDVSAALGRAMTERYLAAFPALDRRAFGRSSAILAAQRSSKILGIFTRLARRDGKPQYLAHIPRIWRLVERDLQEPALTPIRRWLDRHLPPPQRRAPDPPDVRPEIRPRAGSGS